MGNGRVNILVMNDRGGIVLALNRQRLQRGSLAFAAAAALLALAVILLRSQSHSLTPQALGAWQERLDAQRAAVDELRAEHDRKMQAVSEELAGLHVRLAGLQATGSRVIEYTPLKGIIDFAPSLAVGGPEVPLISPAEAASRYALFSVVNEIEQVKQRIIDQRWRLDLLDRLLFHQRAQQDIGLDGDIVDNARISSGYGLRVDPFSKQRVWHLGLDLASHIGAPIRAAAAGIVTRAELHEGYGLMVEIDHGNHFITRYAHNRENLVSAGDVVNKSQLIAKMGNTGRSTGPHVHFEVRKNGRSINPLRYMPESVLSRASAP